MHLVVFALRPCGTLVLSDWHAKMVAQRSPSPHIGRFASGFILCSRKCKNCFLTGKGNFQTTIRFDRCPKMHLKTQSQQSTRKTELSPCVSRPLRYFLHDVPAKVPIFLNTSMVAPCQWCQQRPSRIQRISR